MAFNLISLEMQSIITEMWLKQNGHNFAECKCIFINQNFCIFINISPNFIPMSQPRWKKPNRKKFYSYLHTQNMNNNKEIDKAIKQLKKKKSLGQNEFQMKSS